MNLYTYMYVHTHIPEYRLFSQYNVTCKYVFRVGYLPNTLQKIPLIYIFVNSAYKTHFTDIPNWPEPVPRAAINFMFTYPIHSTTGVCDVAGIVQGIGDEALK